MKSLGKAFNWAETTKGKRLFLGVALLDRVLKRLINQSNLESQPWKIRYKMGIKNTYYCWIRSWVIKSRLPVRVACRNEFNFFVSYKSYTKKLWLFDSLG